MTAFWCISTAGFFKALCETISLITVLEFLTDLELPNKGLHLVEQFNHIAGQSEVTRLNPFH